MPDVAQDYFGNAHSGVEHALTNPKAYWPVGAYACGGPDLPWLLLDSARDNALRAMVTYVSGSRLELLQAAVAVGAAVEQAAKDALHGSSRPCWQRRGKLTPFSGSLDTKTWCALLPPTYERLV